MTSLQLDNPNSNRCSDGTVLLTFIAVAMACLSLSSCCYHPLTVQTQILNEEHLASSVIKTPDPRLNCPDIGQRLLVQWSLLPCQFKNHHLMLFLKVRFADHQEQEIEVPIHARQGTYLYDLINEDYCRSGGIQTYLAEIRNEDQVIACWMHPLWTRLITFEN